MTRSPSVFMNVGRRGKALVLSYFPLKSVVFYMFLRNETKMKPSETNGKHS